MKYLPGYYNVSVNRRSNCALAICFLLLCGFIFQSKADCPTINTSFTTTPSTICNVVSTAVSFNNTSTGVDAPTADYTWYVNGTLFASTTGLTAPAPHTINTANVYNFMLVAFNPLTACYDTSWSTVVMAPQPTAAFTFDNNNQCPGAVITFTNGTTNTVPFTSYVWDFGDGSTSTAPNPTHVYVLGGSYTVNLLVTNASGCTSTINHVVTVLPKPQASFLGEDADGDLKYCVPPAMTSPTDPVKFTNNSIGGTTFDWTFGDGGSTSLASTAAVNYTYTSLGTYPVTLTVTGANGCTDVKTQNVIFIKYVVWKVEVPIAEKFGCVPHTVHPDNLCENAESYIWDFGDGSPLINTTTNTAPTHTYVNSSNPSYMITVTATNACGPAVTGVGPIIVSPKPNLNFTINPAAQGCANPAYSVTFVNNSTGASPADNYDWNFGNGVILLDSKPAPGQTYPYGTWTVSLASSNGCGSDTLKKTIIVDTIPVAKISASILEGCTPLPVSVTNTSTGGSLTYQWYVNGALVSTAATLPAQTLTAPAGNAVQNHTIRLLVTNGCGSDDTTITVKVHPLVTSSFSLSSSIICTGNSVSFTQASQGDQLTYQWNFGNGNTSTLANPPAETYTTAGNYTITLQVTGYCPGPVTYTLGLTVNQTPVAPTAADQTICSGETATLTATVSGNTYEWFSTPTGGTMISSGSVYITPALTNSTDYYVQTTILNCTGPRTKVQVLVNPIPATPFARDTVICVGQTLTLTASGSTGSYAWYLTSTGGTPLATTAAYTVSPAATTDYFVETTVLGCTSPRKQVHVTVNPVPVAVIGSASNICKESVTAFNNLTPTPTISWLWDFGDGSATSALENPSHTYNLTPFSASTYTVSLTVYAASNCSNTITKVITVNPVPNTSFTYTNSICAKDSVKVTSTTPGSPDTFSWDFGGGIINNGNHVQLSQYYGIAGTYTITLTAGFSATGCTKSTSHTVVVNPRTNPDFTATTACLKSNTTFTDASTGNPTQWTLNFGDGSPTANTANTNHTYASAGTFTATLYTQNTFGCLDSVKKTITVNPLPVAAFNADSVCLNTATTFTDVSSSATSWNWNFGDGTAPVTINSPQHTYANPGTYTVLLTVTNQYGCQDTISHKVKVFSIPLASFTAANVCFGDSVKFQNTSTNANSFSWSFGDGSPVSSLTHPAHLYLTPNTYTVTLDVLNAKGCTAKATNQVTILPKPKADFTSSGFCAGQATQFTNTSTGTVASWNWDFNDAGATSTLKDPDHIYTNAGSYTVTLIAVGANSCRDTVKKNITINPVPVVEFTYANACTKDSVKFTSTSTGTPDIFSWNFGDGTTNTANLSAVSHPYLNPGNYTVTLTAGYVATGCTNTNSHTITVYGRTNPGFISANVCLRQTVSFTDTTKGNPVSWLWDFGDGSIKETTQNTNHLYTNPGTYQVQLTTKNTEGCTDSVKIPVVVHPLPIPGFSINNICAAKTAVFTDQSTGAVSWLWNLGDGSPNQFTSSVQHPYNTPGTYQIKQVVTNQFGCKDSVTKPLTVHPNPTNSFSVSSFCLSFPTNFVYTDPSVPNLSWDFGDGQTATNTASVNHIYAFPGLYSVTLKITNSFGCKDSTTRTIEIISKPDINFKFNDACIRRNIQFNKITTDINIISYEWNFGDGGTSTLPDPGYTYLSGGVKTVTLIAKNTVGCSDTIRKNVTVYDLPKPLFSANSACLGTATNFKDLSTDLVPIKNWFYDFNDGNNSVSANPAYIYASAGLYNVTLTVTNDKGCDSSVTIPVRVNPIPVANYTADTVCLGSATTFTDLSTGNPNFWQWDFGDGSGSTVGPVTSHIYAAEGVYYTSLTVKVDSLCAAQFIKLVRVSGEVKAGIKSNKRVCVNTLLQLVDNSQVTSGTIALSSWDFGDGSAIEQGLAVDHSWSQPGTYIVTHTVTSSAGCASVIKDTIKVVPLPKADFTFTTICEDQPAKFTDQSSAAATTWNWYFGDGTQSVLQNPVHHYTNPGTYTVSLVVGTPESCFDSIAKTITVIKKPTASFTYKQFCLGDTVKFTNTSTTTTGVIQSYNWNFHDGNTSTVLNPLHLFTAVKDSFDVTLIVVTDMGCSDTLNKKVGTYPLTVFNFGPLQASGCEDYTASFQDNSTVANGAIVNWLWDFGDGSSTYSHNPTHTYTQPGKFFVALTLTNSYGCVMKDTLNFPVIVYPKPVAGFIPSVPDVSIFTPTIQFQNSSIGATMWDWDFGDHSSSILEYTEHTYNDTGYYVVTQIAINQYGCRDTMKQKVHVHGEITVYFPTAFTPDNNGLNDYYAPVYDGIKEMEIMIYDRWGQQIYKSADMTHGWNGKLNGTGDPAPIGVYVYRVTTIDILNNTRTHTGSFTLFR